MIGELVTLSCCNLPLSALNFRVNEFFNIAAAHANEVVMVPPFLKLVGRSPFVEMTAHKNACIFKLSEHTLNRRQANVAVFL